MLKLSPSNKIAKGSDRVVDLTFNRKPDDDRSMIGAVIIIRFFHKTLDLTGWQLSTANNLVRAQNLAAIQQVRGVIPRALIATIPPSSTVTYAVSIDYGGLVEIDPENYTGFFAVIDPAIDQSKITDY